MDIIPPIPIKCIILGKHNIGKSSLVKRYIKDEYDVFSESTIGCAFCSKNIVFKENPTLNENSVKLEIWDTAGQERFRSILPMYFRNAHIVFICIDLSDKTPLKKQLIYWMQELDKYTIISSTIIYLVGTKVDAMNKSKEIEISNIREEYSNIRIFKTSAKLNIGVDEVFISCVKDYLKINRKHSRDIGNMLTTINKDLDKEEGCFKNFCIIS